MVEKKIEHIAYQLQHNKKDNKPGAIVFIGAGCSVSAGIPLSDKIVEYVLEDYKDNPDINCLSEKPSYSELMGCLGPQDRKKIFKYYVDRAKINVSHIYLAHLMFNYYVDYIITVNFDNLAQRALALYNIFPPTYDISILKDLTTTTIDTKSITYLHGQYNGLWQLNTDEEMKKVIDSNVANSIFTKITNNRLWIIVGYSGEDFIFDQLVKLGRFDNGLYWIGYKDNEPSKKVQNELLNQPNTESFLVKGYDSDSFFLKLNAKLEMEDPKIFNLPFSFLSELLESIVDIEDTENYKYVKGRLTESKRMVLDAINKYEKAGSKEPPMTIEEIEQTQLMNELINCLITEKYEELSDLENKLINKGYHELLPIVSDIYYNWGTDLGNLAQSKTGSEAEALYIQVFEKYSKAIELKADYNKAYYNWGTYLGNFAQTKSGLEAEELYKRAFEKYSKAIKIKPDYYDAYYNWGTCLGKLAQEKFGTEAEALYNQAFEKFSKAVEIKPDYYDAYYNWGTCLGKMAQEKSGTEAEALYNQAFEKFSRAIKIKPDYFKAYSNWGTYLGNLAQTKSGAEAETLYNQAFEKYSKAIKIKSDDHEAYYNWGTNLGNLAQTKSSAEAETLYLQAFEKYGNAIEIKPDKYEAYFGWGTYFGYLAQTKSGSEAETLYNQAFEKFSKAIEIKPDYYEAYYNWGTGLGKLAQTKSGSEAETLYNQAFEKYCKAVEIKPGYHEAYTNWGADLGKLAQTKSGVEAETLYKQAFEKYSKAIEIKPDMHEAYYNWGNALRNLAEIKSGSETEELYLQAFEKLKTAADLGGEYYNLACLNAKTKNINEAFRLLEICLQNNEVTFKFIETDQDWSDLREEPEYKRLKQIFLK